MNADVLNTFYSSFDFHQCCLFLVNKYSLTCQMIQVWINEMNFIVSKKFGKFIEILSVLLNIDL